jgi:methyl-accepting chemotaxis protein
LRDATAWSLIRDGMVTLVDTTDPVIRVIGEPVRDGGLQIEVTIEQGPLRLAMRDYGLNILLLSLVISVITAALLFFAVRRFLVKPIMGVVESMKTYAAAPEDARAVITPSAGVSELRDAEEALQSLQPQLSSALKQRDRLAQLGSGVS